MPTSLSGTAHAETVAARPPVCRARPSPPRSLS
jgi:hypothetical protein